MRKWLNIYFSFSKREFNGLLVMIVLLAVVTAIPAVYEFLFPDREDPGKENAAIEKLILIEKERDKKIASWRKEIKTGAKPGRLFRFDPNSTTLEEWQLLGFSAKQAAVLLRYTTKGGRFRKKEDLKKMYVVTAQLYERLLPYIYVSPQAFPERTFAYPLKAAFNIVSLNTADTLELTTVKGIGPAFARRIVNYRNRLGGFYKKEQLKEVFGLDSVRYQEIEGQVKLGELAVIRIAINLAGFEELRHHPYLSYKQINAILQYRKQHGNYSNIAHLKKVAILSELTLEKLAPYISFDHD